MKREGQRERERAKGREGKGGHRDVVTTSWEATESEYEYR